MKTRAVAATHTGLTRDNNEDSFLVQDRLWAVADGLGDHAAGEVASRMAVDALRLFPSPLTMIRVQPFEPGAALIETFRCIHQDIVQAGQGMGTTLTAAVLAGETLHLVHTGDSAAYLIRNGWSRRLTEDQTIGGGLRLAGKVANARQDHTLVNCLGVSQDSFQGAQHVPLHLVPGDVVVLGTDGLTGYIATEQEVAVIASRAKRFEDLAQVFVDHALQGGGDDNVTVVVVEFR